MAWYDEYIQQIPGVVGGEPAMKGTRISVLAVVEYFQLYGSIIKLVELFPDVQPDGFKAALHYYEDHKAEIDSYRREHAESDQDMESIPNLFRLSA